MLSAVARVSAGSRRRRALRSSMGGASEFQFEADGAVVAAHDFGADPGAFERGAQGGGGDEVVDAPPDVAGAAVGHLAPPRVVAGAFFELAEGVDEAGVEQGGEVVALLVGEAGAAVVGLGVGDVEL